MTRRLLLTYLSVTLFVLLVLEVPLGVSFARQEKRELVTGLQRDALVLATLVEDRLEHGAGDVAPARAASAYHERTGGRVVITDRAGTSIADTEGYDLGRDFATRPEIAAALSGEIASGTRRSSTLGYDLVYVAVPVASGGVVHGAVRITYPASAIASRVRGTWMLLGLVALVVLTVVAIAGWALARSVTSPVATLATAAAAISSGDLSARTGTPGGPPEIRSLARRFDEMADRIEDLVASQQAFVADASHQLRTPLTALRLRLENMEAAAPADLRAEAAAAVREAQRLGRIVDGLLAIARAEAGPPERREIDLASSVRDRSATWRPLATERGVQIDAQTPAGCPVFAVPGHVEQILDNLIENAIAASPPGSTIRVVVREHATGPEIHVLDEGPGMGERDRERAFDRFWRGETERPGSGLGLAIVQRLAVASGAEPSLEPAPSGGLDAIVRFPAA